MPPVSLLAAVSVLSACANRGAPELQRADPADRAASVQSSSDFPPVRVRFHPLTHLVAEVDGGSAPQIDAHLELLDRFGLPTRALGEFRFILRAGSDDASRLKSTIPDFDGAMVWTIDMRDAENNAMRYYDRVTRTYRIALASPILKELREAFTLEAQFFGAGVATLPVTMNFPPPR